MCSVAVHHSFHLNIGTRAFDELSSAEKRRQLARYDVFEDVHLVVPSDTQRVLAGLGCLLKKVPTGLLLLQEVADPDSEGPFVPARVPDREFRLRFVLVGRQPFFWNYTNLGLDASNPSIYYLSNLIGPLGGTFPDLCAPPSEFSAGADYRAGDLVRTRVPVEATYLAVRAGTLAAPAPDGDASWQKLASHNYLGGADRVAIRRPSFALQVPSSADIERVELVGLDGTHFGTKITGEAQRQNQKELFVDAGQTPPGRYTLRLSGHGGDNGLPIVPPLYLDAELAAQRVFAIIELFHAPNADLGDFRLYDQDQATGIILRDPAPTFFLRLLNRHTFWRYRFPERPSDESPTAQPAGEDSAPVPGDHLEKVPGKNWYVTKKAMPLTSGFQEVQFNSTMEAPLLPNPSIRHIVPEADRVYSDIHLQVQPK
jgi:hypothetical protein